MKLFNESKSASIFRVGNLKNKEKGKEKLLSENSQRRFLTQIINNKIYLRENYQFESKGP